MRIACLQFSPHVGDIDNNLNRADAVLNKAKPEELEALDMLVLPEMAFSGMLGSHMPQMAIVPGMHRNQRPALSHTLETDPTLIYRIQLHVSATDTSVPGTLRLRDQRPLGSYNGTQVRYQGCCRLP